MSQLIRLQQETVHQSKMHQYYIRACEKVTANKRMFAAVLASEQAGSDLTQPTWGCALAR